MDSDDKSFCIFFGSVFAAIAVMVVASMYFGAQEKIACYEAAKTNPKIECPK